MNNRLSPWSKTNYADKTFREALSMSVFCNSHPLVPLRNILRNKNVITAAELRRLPDNSIVRVSGMVIIIHTPPTKSGQRVMFLTLEDETGLFDVVVFSRTQETFAKIILQSEVLTLDGQLHRQGKSGKSISIIMERCLLGLSGSLLRLLGPRLQVPFTPRPPDSRPKMGETEQRRIKRCFPEQLNLPY